MDKHSKWEEWLKACLKYATLTKFIRNFNVTYNMFS